MKTILVPTDFSENAAHAFRFATLLARKLKARLILFNAFQVPIPVAAISYSLLQEMREDKRNEANARLRAECGPLQLADDVAYGFHAEEGEVPDAILEYAAKHNVDYIVIGTRGAGKSSAVFGSTATRLMAKTDIPVIAIPEKAHISENIHRITFATDYAVTDADAITQLSALASAFDAQINVLHISDSDTPPAEQSTLMKAFMEKVNAETTYSNLSFQLLSGENPGKRLEEYIHAHNTDMIVMSTHLRNMLERLLTGSLTKQIALKTQIPLIVFHHHKKATLKLTP